MKTWSAWVFVLLLVLPAAVRAAGKEKPPKSLDPYGTAERETPQPLATTDLAYRVVVFDEIDIPDNLKKDNAKYVDQTKTQAMTRLRSTQAFTKVDVKTDTIPDEPFLLVKCVVHQVKLFDGKSGDLLHDTRLSTANNAFAGAFLSNDKKLVPYLGNVIADYVALRARSDKGVSVIPLDWPPPAK